jgi:type IV pilus assembly protein PilP
MKIKVPQMMLNKFVTAASVRFLLMTFTMVILTACSDNDFTDLQQYIATIKAKPKEAVKPLPEFKVVEPFILTKEGHLRDPFKPIEKVVAEALEPDEVEEPDNGIRPNTNRTKEPLEAFALSGMRMVGTINMNATLWGLVKGDGNTIYRVKAGNYIGKNDGKITQINKNKIELIEIIPSKPGRFIEQPATLTLTE